MIKEILLKKAQGLPVVEKPEGLRRFVHCLVGDTDFLIELEKVKELVPLVDITDIPGTDYNILGALNLRGDIVIIIDLREKLGVSQVRKTILSRFVIVNVENELLGIFVDEAQKIIDITKEQFLENEDSGNDFYSEYAEVEGKKIGVLNLKKIFLDYKISEV